MPAQLFAGSCCARAAHRLHHALHTHSRAGLASSTGGRLPLTCPRAPLQAFLACEPWPAQDSLRSTTRAMHRSVEPSPAQFDHAIARLGGSADLSTSVTKAADCSSSVPKAGSSYLRSSTSTCAELSMSPRAAALLAAASAEPAWPDIGNLPNSTDPGQAAAVNVLASFQRKDRAVAANPAQSSTHEAAQPAVSSGSSSVQPANDAARDEMPAAAAAPPVTPHGSLRSALARTLSRSSKRSEVPAGASPQGTSPGNSRSQDSTSKSRSNTSVHEDSGSVRQGHGLMRKGRNRVMQLFTSKPTKQSSRASAASTGAVFQDNQHAGTGQLTAARRRKKSKAGANTAPMALPNAPWAIRRKKVRSAARPPRPPGRMLSRRPPVAQPYTAAGSTDARAAASLVAGAGTRVSNDAAGLRGVDAVARVSSGTNASSTATTAQQRNSLGASPQAVSKSSNASMPRAANSIKHEDAEVRTSRSPSAAAAQPSQAALPHNSAPQPALSMADTFARASAAAAQASPGQAVRNAAQHTASQPPAAPAPICAQQSIELIYKSLEKSGSVNSRMKPAQPTKPPATSAVHHVKELSHVSSYHTDSLPGTPRRGDATPSRIPCSPRRRGATSQHDATTSTQTSPDSTAMASVQSLRVGSPRVSDVSPARSRNRARDDAARAAHVRRAAALTTLPGMPQHLAARIWEDFEEPKFCWENSRTQVRSLNFGALSTCVSI